VPQCNSSGNNLQHVESQKSAKLVLGEVVQTAVYVLNRVLTKSVEGAMPFELWYGKKPSIHHRCTFGCIAYVRNIMPHLSKLEDRGRRMIFVGYERGTKAYMVYDPATRRVHITRDVVFDEEHQWDWSKSVDGATREGDFSVEYMVLSTRRPSKEHTDADAMELQAPAAGEASPPILTEGIGIDPEQVMPESPNLSDQLDADHDDATLRLRLVDSKMGEAPLPGLAMRNLF
jgi:hypothetical protein